jgi:hypothetical protein
MQAVCNAGKTGNPMGAAKSAQTSSEYRRVYRGQIYPASHGGILSLATRTLLAELCEEEKQVGHVCSSITVRVAGPRRNRAKSTQEL